MTNDEIVASIDARLAEARAELEVLESARGVLSNGKVPVARPRKRNKRGVLNEVRARASDPEFLVSLRQVMAEEAASLDAQKSG